MANLEMLKMLGKMHIFSQMVVNKLSLTMVVENTKRHQSNKHSWIKNNFSTSKTLAFSAEISPPKWVLFYVPCVDVPGS